jgi:hypothetical protein
MAHRMRTHKQAVGLIAAPWPAGSRVTPAPGDGVITRAEDDSNVGRHWLSAAADMAAVASGNWPLSADPPPLGWTCFPQTATRAQAVEARLVRAARDFTIATMRRWGATERCQDIAIVASELLTNALLHAVPGSGQSHPGWPIRFGLLHTGPFVLCAVADASESPPVLKEPSDLAETGRGMHVISALSDKWGYTTYARPNDAGKVVWAMFVTMPAR